MPEGDAGSAEAKSRVYGSGRRLIGKDYKTADLYAKVTGLARYAEDYHADGMLYCKLLLSPLPHARVKHLDLREALAMPGVKAILTADELPPPADTLTDNGTVIRANPKSERALTMEPLYQGEPILAVAAVDEYTAAEAIEKIRIDFDPLPFVIDPLDTLRPGGPNPRAEGNIWVQHPAPATAAGARPAAPAPPTLGILKWTEADFADEKKADCLRETLPTNGLTGMFKRASKGPRSSSMKRLSRQTRATRLSSPAPPWLTGRTERSMCTRARKAPRNPCQLLEGG